MAVDMVDMVDMADITRRGMHRLVMLCANASPAVLVITTGIGGVAADTVILMVTGIRTAMGTAIAAK